MGDPLFVPAKDTVDLKKMKRSNLLDLTKYSCVPNAVVEFPFNNHELVMTAATDISPGEEILIRYSTDRFRRHLTSDQSQAEQVQWNMYQFSRNIAHREIFY